MRAAEGLGFRYGWTFDSHVLWQEPFVIYSQILAATESIMVGPMVTNPATRDWSVIAALFATLNDMFGNRTVCGIGRGDARDQGPRRGPLDRAPRHTGPDPVGTRRQAGDLDGGLRAEGAETRRR